CGLTRACCCRGVSAAAAARVDSPLGRAAAAARPAAEAQVVRWQAAQFVSVGTTTALRVVGSVSREAALIRLVSADLACLPGHHPARRLDHPVLPAGPRLGLRGGACRSDQRPRTSPPPDPALGGTPRGRASGCARPGGP